jgi:hypothetical protein
LAQARSFPGKDNEDGLSYVLRVRGIADETQGDGIDEINVPLNQGGKRRFRIAIGVFPDQIHVGRFSHLLIYWPPTLKVGHLFSRDQGKAPVFFRGGVYALAPHGLTGYQVSAPVNEIQSTFQRNGQRLVWRSQDQMLWVEPWGGDSLRVRATTLAEMPLRDWSLLPAKKSSARVAIEKDSARVVNGKLTRRLTRNPRVRFFKSAGGNRWSKKFRAHEPSAVPHFQIGRRRFVPLRSAVCRV